VAQKHFNELKYNKHHNKQENQGILTGKCQNTFLRPKRKGKHNIRTCTYELREASTDPIVLFDDAAKYCNRNESVLHE
jgi:hypothetical protein